jgi:hypothetical protein
MENKNTKTHKVARSAAFCSYRSYRFNEQVHAHFFQEGNYPPFAVMRDYFRRATETTIRDYIPHKHPAYLYV